MSETMSFAMGEEQPMVTPAGADSTAANWPKAKRVVLKIGSSTLLGEGRSLDSDFISRLARQVAEVRNHGCECIIVTSGAIAAGLPVLGLDRRPQDMPSLQACASVGQVCLVNAYDRAFRELGIPTGQILLTRNDTGSRSAYLHARDTIDRLLAMGVVPIVNENDTVAVDEIRFGDNDSLAAIVGSLSSADLVVLLSDIDGLYTSDPRSDPDARRLEVVSTIDDDLLAAAGDAGTGVGTGGMRTKVRAARAMQMAGIPLVICLGRQDNALVDAVLGKPIGTRFVPAPGSQHESSRKLWIALAGHDAGSVTIDDGARAALHSRGGSLLPVGVIAVDGHFGRGDVIAVRDTQHTLIGRGIARYTSDEAMLTRGMRLDMVARVVPQLADTPLVHRDELIVF